LWVAILLLYPLLSVYPQEVIFRAFFLHRYAKLFPTGALTRLAAAVFFGWAHVIYGSYLAIGLSTLGGLQFVRTYRSSQSLRTVTIEHGLYGILIFTLGLGEFFYRR
jgi:glucose uptake protein GlcU